MKKVFVLLSIYLVAQVLWLLPAPSGMGIDAWHLFSLFVALILGVLFRPFPLGATALIALTAAIATRTLGIENALQGFSNETVWLILSAMFISRGFVTTGLGKRLSYKILSVFGGSSLGIGYGLVLTDLILAPTIPSVTARVGGIVYPILRSITELFDKKSKVDAFLTQTVFQGSVVTSAMFLTSIAGNPLIAALSGENGIQITWTLWMVAAIVPGLISLCVVPYVVFRLISPQVRKTPETKGMAKKNHAELGKMKKEEWMVVGTFVFLMALWIIGPRFGIGPTTTALIGLAILLVTKVLDWKDLLSQGSAWDIFIWFSVLITFSSALNKLGFSSYLSTEITKHIQGLNWVVGFGVLSLIYFYLHYLFVSSIAQISALYMSFLILAVSLGTPPLLAALTLGFFSSLMASLTHYGAGQAPILFEMGTMTATTWWKTGFIVSLVNIVIWLGIGSLWWKLIGVF